MNNKISKACALLLVTTSSFLFAQPADNPNAQPNSTEQQNEKNNTQNSEQAKDSPSSEKQDTKAKPSIDDYLKDSASYKKGIFDVFLKDKKWQAKISKKLLNERLWLSTKINKGIGNFPFHTGAPGPTWLIEFSQKEEQFYVRAKPHYYQGKEVFNNSNPNEIYLTDGFLSASPVLFEDDEFLIIDAQSLFFTDYMRLAELLEQQFEIAFSLDAKNSNLLSIETHEDEVRWNLEQHFFSSKLTPKAKKHISALSQSLLPVIEMSIKRLPKTPLTPIIANEKVGYLTVNSTELSAALNQDGSGAPINRIYGSEKFIARWRMEPKTESLNNTLLEPKNPINVFICPSFPEHYLQAAKNGVSFWIKSFEKAGWKNAINITKLNTNEKIPLGINSIDLCWYAAVGASAAYGPSKVDPRSGEILSASIMMPNIFEKQAFIDYLQNSNNHESNLSEKHQTHNHQIWHEQNSQDLIKTLLTKKDEELRQRINIYIEQIIAHEMGHTLGLRHNFKASTFLDSTKMKAQISQTVPSVMDYIPLESIGKYVSYTQNVGPYDDFAIKFGYKYFKDENQRLQYFDDFFKNFQDKKELFYSTDEDNTNKGLARVDVNAFTLSEDSLSWFELEDESNRKQLEFLSQKIVNKEFVDGLLMRMAIASFNNNKNALLQNSLITLQGSSINWERTQDKVQKKIEPISKKSQQKALKIMFNLLTDDPIIDNYLKIITPYALIDGKFLDPNSDISINQERFKIQLKEKIISAVFNQRLLENFERLRVFDQSLISAKQWLASWRFKIWNSNDNKSQHLQLLWIDTLLSNQNSSFSDQKLLLTKELEETKIILKNKNDAFSKTQLERIENSYNPKK